MLSRTVTGIFLFVLFAATMHAQVEVSSRFLPNKEYTILVSRALSGNDGYKDVVPTSNGQRFVVKTGAGDQGSFPVELTVYTPTQAGSSTQIERVEWDFTFTVSPDGALEDIAVVSSVEVMDEGLARSILSRHLGDLLLLPAYRLETGRNEGKVQLEKVVQRDGTGEIHDVTYIVQLPELKEVGAPMAQSADGYGVYDAQLGFFTELVKHEMSKIFVYEDATGAENHIVMKRETRIVTTIRDVNP